MRVFLLVGPSSGSGSEGNGDGDGDGDGEGDEEEEEDEDEDEDEGKGVDGEGQEEIQDDQRPTRHPARNRGDAADCNTGDQIARRTRNRRGGGRGNGKVHARMPKRYVETLFFRKLSSSQTMIGIDQNIRSISSLLSRFPSSHATPADPVAAAAKAREMVAAVATTAPRHAPRTKTG